MSVSVRAALRCVLWLWLSDSPGLIIINTLWLKIWWLVVFIPDFGRRVLPMVNNIGGWRRPYKCLCCILYRGVVVRWTQTNDLRYVPLRIRRQSMTEVHWFRDASVFEGFPLTRDNWCLVGFPTLSLSLSLSILSIMNYEFWCSRGTRAWTVLVCSGDCDGTLGSYDNTKAPLINTSL